MVRKASVPFPGERKSRNKFLRFGGVIDEEEHYSSRKNGADPPAGLLAMIPDPEFLPWEEEVFSENRTVFLKDCLVADQSGRFVGAIVPVGSRSEKVIFPQRFVRHRNRPGGKVIIK